MRFSCVENCVCSGCFKKQKVIDKLQLELEGLKTENVLLRRQVTKGRNVLAKIRTYAGLPNKKTFNNLVKYVSQKSKKLHYWWGSKKAFSTKVCRNFKASPKKSKKTGLQRKLSVREELTLVSLKLRTAITNEVLADLHNRLQWNIYWPSKKSWNSGSQLVGL